jgi:hypothetical protein
MRMHEPPVEVLTAPFYLQINLRPASFLNTPALHPIAYCFRRRRSSAASAASGRAGRRQRWPWPEHRWVVLKGGSRMSCHARPPAPRHAPRRASLALPIRSAWWGTRWSPLPPSPTWAPSQHRGAPASSNTPSSPAPARCAAPWNQMLLAWNRMLLTLISSCRSSQLRAPSFLAVGTTPSTSNSRLQPGPHHPLHAIPGLLSGCARQPAFQPGCHARQPTTHA